MSLPLLLIAANLLGVVFLVLKFKDFGIGALHLSSLFLFQTTGSISYLMGYERIGTDVPALLGTIVGRLVEYIVFFVLAYIIARVYIQTKKSREASRMVNRKSNPISFFPWFTLIRLLSLLELALYVILFAFSIGIAGRLELTQIQKVPYYASVLSLMFYLSRGIPENKLNSVILAFLIPKLFVGFLGWRGSFAWLGIPLIVLAYGERAISFAVRSMKTILKLRISKIFLLLPWLILAIFLMLFALPTVIRGDSWSFLGERNVLAVFLGEFTGSPFWLGFQNASLGSDADSILWPVSSFIDIYLQPFFSFGDAYEATPFNLPLRYDRYLTQKILTPEALDQGLGTGGSLSGELSASSIDFSSLIGLIVGLLSAVIDHRSVGQSFILGKTLPAFARFMTLWIAAKIFYLPRGTITEVFDMIPLLTLIYFGVSGLLLISMRRSSFSRETKTEQ
jgi:hypothetical protein